MMRSQWELMLKKTSSNTVWFLCQKPHIWSKNLLICPIQPTHERKYLIKISLLFLECYIKSLSLRYESVVSDKETTLYFMPSSFD